MNKRIRPTIKHGTALTAKERAQMEALIQTDALEANYLQRHHIQKMSVWFYLYKVEDQIMAYQGVSWHQLQTPFSPRPWPVLYINIAYKHPEAPAGTKDFARRTNFHAVRQHLGPFWMFRPFLVAFTTVNPKAMERIQRIFGYYYPDGKTTPPEAIHAMATTFVQDHLKRANPPTPSLMVPLEPTESPSDFTAYWQQHYAATQAYWNDFFFKEAVFEHRAGRYFYTGQKMVLFFGVYTFWGLLRRWWQGLNPFQ